MNAAQRKTDSLILPAKGDLVCHRIKDAEVAQNVFVRAPSNAYQAPSISEPFLLSWVSLGAPIGATIVCSARVPFRTIFRKHIGQVVDGDFSYTAPDNGVDRIDDPGGMFRLRQDREAAQSSPILRRLRRFEDRRARSIQPRLSVQTEPCL